MHKELVEKKKRVVEDHFLQALNFCMLLPGPEAQQLATYIGILFSKAAIVTFGGAYAVLAYIGQQAVNHYHWIMPEQMMDGPGLAETTPGLLIMVNQFVGYLAGYYHADGLPPALGGAIGGLLATWVAFIPSFLMIFLLAPSIETLRKNTKRGAALAAITAAVVGVVLNLAVIFTRHTLVPDTGASIGTRSLRQRSRSWE